MKDWMKKTNRAYTIMCGERVTNYDVLITHAVLAGMLLVSALAGQIW